MSRGRAFAGGLALLFAGASACADLIGADFDPYRAESASTSAATSTSSAEASTTSASASGGGQGGAGAGPGSTSSAGGGGSGGAPCEPQPTEDCATATDETCEGGNEECGAVLWARQLPAEEDPELESILIGDLTPSLGGVFPATLSASFGGRFMGLEGHDSSIGTFFAEVGDTDELISPYFLDCEPPCTFADIAALTFIGPQNRAILAGEYGIAFPPDPSGQEHFMPEGLRSYFGSMTNPTGSPPSPGGWMSPEVEELEDIDPYGLDSVVLTEGGDGLFAHVGMTTRGHVHFGLSEQPTAGRYFVGVGRLQPFLQRWGGYLGASAAGTDNACQRTAPRDAAPDGMDLSFTEQGSLWVAGTYCSSLVFLGTLPGNRDGFVARLDVGFPGQGNNLDFSAAPALTFDATATGVAALSETDAVIIGDLEREGVLPNGEAASPAGASDVFVARVRASGDGVETLWTTVLSGVKRERAFDVAVVRSPLGQPTIYVAGGTDGQVTAGGVTVPPSDVLGQSAFVWKLDEDGGTIWIRAFGGGAANAEALEGTEAGGVVVALQPGGSDFRMGDLAVGRHTSLVIAELAP